MSPQPSSKLLEEPVDVASSAPPSLNSSRKDETQEHSETAEHKVYRPHPVEPPIKDPSGKGYPLYKGHTSKSQMFIFPYC